MATCVIAAGAPSSLPSSSSQAKPDTQSPGRAGVTISLPEPLIGQLQPGTAGQDQRHGVTVAAFTQLLPSRLGAGLTSIFSLVFFRLLRRESRGLGLFWPRVLKSQKIPLLLPTSVPPQQGPDSAEQQDEAGGGHELPGARVGLHSADASPLHSKNIMRCWQPQHWALRAGAA